MQGAIAVIGSSRMTDLYVLALHAIGLRAEALDGDPYLRAALHGIARDADLI